MEDKWAPKSVLLAQLQRMFSTCANVQLTPLWSTTKREAQVSFTG